MKERPHRLLTIAHSYCVALNRRLAHEMERVGCGTWAVTAVAPARLHGDLRRIATERLRNEPCDLRCVTAHLSQHIHLMFYGSALRRIVREGWDVVHCWEEPYIVAAAQVARWTPRDIPLVFTTYQNLRKNYPPPFDTIERFSLRRAAGWIAGGALVEQALQDRCGYAGRPHAVIPMGTDVAHFHPDREAGTAARHSLEWSAPDPAAVGFIGRFVEDKGPRVLMQALDAVQCEWRALFVGGGPLEDEIRAWAGRYPGRVRVVTGVAHDDVWRWLNAMDVLCVPSQTRPGWQEQFGRVIVEGFACGVPVLASDSGEIPRVVSHAGVVIGERDVPGWARHITRLLGAPAERAVLGEAGRRRAVEQYAWAVIARKHLDFFESLQHSRAAAGSRVAHAG
jgi:phosphatidyl-myo-inositol dimannoside synthase